MTAPQLTPSPDPATPASPSPTASVPAGGTPAPEAWKAPTSAPAWAQGKSPDEVLTLATQMAAALSTMMPAKAEEPPANGQPPKITDDDFITRPHAAAAAVAGQTVASALDPIQQAMAGLQAQHASTNRALAVQQFKADFDRWGPEIDGLMGQFAKDPGQRTLDNYERVIKYVRGNHVDEIAAERAKQIIAQGGLGERSGGSNGGVSPNTPGFQPDKLGPDRAELIRRHGLTEAQVNDYCRKNNLTMEGWMAAAQNNKVFTSISPFEMQMSDEVLGIKGRFGE